MTPPEPTQYIDEIANTEAAVNSAAVEHEKDDCQKFPFAGILMLADGQPDFIFHIDAGDDLYFVGCTDAGPRLNYRGCGRVELPRHAAMLYAVHNALSSISGRTLNERLCARYSYQTRGEAKLSGRKLIIRIQVADPDLAELGETFAGSSDPQKLLKYLAPDDAKLYSGLVQQIKRFQTEWQRVPADCPELAAVREWATYALPGIGPDTPYPHGSSELIPYTGKWITKAA